MSLSRHRIGLMLAAWMILSASTGPVVAADFFDDFSYAGGGVDDPVDPQLQCFGWYVRSGSGGPGPTGATWREDYVTWADDPSIPGNRVMRLRATTDGTAEGTFQSEVDSDGDPFLEGTYSARIKFADNIAGAVQPSVQAFVTYKGLVCDPSYSECDIEYTPADPWSTRCGASPALHLQTWEQFCDNPFVEEKLPGMPSPVCGTLAGWHTCTVQISDGTVRYYVDGVLQASHGGRYYPESSMRILLLHWFADPLRAGVYADLTMEVDWIYHAKDTILTAAQTESAVAAYRASGVTRHNGLGTFPDCNANAIPDWCESDSDGDGVIDACDDTKVWRVKWDATGAQTGLTWADAFTGLQSALSAAKAGDEIWVAAGTYQPALPDGDRNLSFRLVSGVGVYGGFAGHEYRRVERNPSLNVTVLSGDLNGNDGALPVNNADNSYVVVAASATDSSTTLDGFTVTGANGTYGGGLFLDGGTVTVHSCTFIGNSAAFGGAICMHESEPTVSRCYFGGNQVLQDGGALYLDLGSAPRIIACVFEGNEAGYAGGAARVLTSSPLFISCTFRGNRAQYGGAIQHYESAAPMFADCLLSGNVAGGAGGAIHNTDSSPLVINCTIGFNSAAQGGGLLGWPPSMTTVANSIVWGNSDLTGNGEQAQVTTATASLSYCCVQNWTGTAGGTAVSAADPLFVDADGPDNVLGNEDDNYRLRGGSPCIDAGDNLILPPDVADLDADGDKTEPIALDVAGYRRLEDAVAVPDTGLGTAPLVDLGPFEYVPVAPGDFDYDRDVDLADLQHLLVCARGPAIPQTLPECLDADLDGDGDVDQTDFGLLQQFLGTRE